MSYAVPRTPAARHGATARHHRPAALDSGHGEGGVGREEGGSGSGHDGSGSEQDGSGAQATVRPGLRVLSTYSDLSKRVQAAGLLERCPRYYWSRIAACGLAFAGIWVGVGLIGNSWLQLILAGAFGIVVTQFAFLGHDGAHRQIFASFRCNEWAGRIFACLFAGLSYSWWMSKHTRHHGGPNQEGRDTDIESAAVALTPAAGLRRHGIGAWFARGQGWLFLPMLLLEGLNLHLDSFRSLLFVRGVKRRWTDLALVTFRLAANLAVLFVLLPPGKAAAFFGVELAALGLFMGGAFAPNHTGMPIVAAGVRLDFLRRQVLMSRNISGGWFIDFLMGGLNHQIEHHLFPSMPRPNLRRARPMVREFCAQQGVAYSETTLIGSYRIIIRYLTKVGLKASDPFTCPLVSQFRN